MSAAVGMEHVAGSAEASGLALYPLSAKMIRVSTAAAGAPARRSWEQT